MRPWFFSPRYFGSRFFAASGANQGYYFGSPYFAAGYFQAGFYGPVTLTTDITASLDATEAPDTLTSSANVTLEEQAGSFTRPRPFIPRLEPITARLDIKERPDTCEATATLGFDPVAMDNELLLLAA